jgi:RimJ/RimL family protein N-acetyltransferase
VPHTSPTMANVGEVPITAHPTGRIGEVDQPGRRTAFERAFPTRRCQGADVALPCSDGLLTIRAPRLDDRAQLILGRDSESERWLGPGSPEPAPTVVIEVDEVVVGWVDGDSLAEWLRPHEINVGYCVFSEHRGNGYAVRALRLFAQQLREWYAGTGLLVIDEHNTVSQVVAQRAGARPIVDRVIARFPTSVVYALDLAAAPVHSTAVSEPVHGSSSSISSA